MSPPYTADAVPSDVDSLSDSDWLEIASNRASDDEDGFVSDRDGTLSLPPSSRRSSISLGSSRDGDVEAWEGIADGDADAASETPGGVSVDTHDDSVRAGPEEGGDRAVDPAEDRRIIEALDQSMVSTLNSSRTGSVSRVSTFHSSLRDLRLSFPDPLAGSREAITSHLESSYEGMTHSTTSVDSSVEMQQEGPSTALTPEALSADVDADCPFVSPEEFSDAFSKIASVADSQELKAQLTFTAQVELFMYGLRMPDRWLFVDRFVNKLASGQMSLLNEPPVVVDECTRLYALENTMRSDNIVVSRIAVYDRTEADATDTSEKLHRGVPSLALVYLPSYPAPTPKVNVPQHKYYHFVTDGKKFPSSFPFFACGQFLPRLRYRTPINAVSSVDATQVAEAFEALLIDKPEPLVPAGFGRAFTLLTLLTIILGVAVGYQSAQSVQRAAPVAHVQKTLMGMWVGSTNHTILPSSSYSAITSSIREMGSFQPLPSTLPPGVQPSTSWSPPAVPVVAIASSSSNAIASSSSSAISSLSTASSFSLSTTTTSSTLSTLFTSAKAAGKRPAGTDVAVRLPGTLSVSPTSILAQSTATTGLGLRLMDMAEELVGAVQRDVRDASTALGHALDGVGSALGDVGNVLGEARNVDAAARLREKRDLILRGTTSVVRAGTEHFAQRNEKARGRARHLKEQGLRLVSDAGEHLWDRVATAQRRARSLREN
ncbi:hypothetical protein BD626DRAFT_491072 [Schizophyllum amplum]|uniref:Uncharacterized protein n=1 Tax=Schizophyllum amplum TaxID=97359 RepID=A0A550CHB9_9AGAR|nr:hypothetical protein BD626DRAFT_491072 [Auriculariopsis ampla]